MKSGIFISSIAVYVALGVGCRRDDGALPDVDTSRPADYGFQISMNDTLQAEGKESYGLYCAGCHGDAGDGQGPAALFFEPRPRNFQLANYKFSSTRSGRLPLDSDLRRTIKEGLKGSAMPPFELLSDRTVDALIVYIKTFSDKWDTQRPAPAIPIVEDPYRELDDKSVAIARGERIYHGYTKCYSCHPAYVSEQRISEHIVSLGITPPPGYRPDLHLGIAKENVEGELLHPPDFKRDFVRSGMSLEDMYRVIAAGITGTAMPTWVDSMTLPSKEAGAADVVTPQDLWALAYYTQDLIRQRPPKLAPSDIVIRERPKRIYLHGAPPQIHKLAEDEDEWGEDDEWEDEDE